jgi:ClpP class serine protease
VFAAQAIVAAMRESRAQIVAHIDGLAASAASVIAVAADRAVAHEGSMVMIHNSWTLAMGNASDMREVADLLDKVDGTIAASYARKSGKTADEFRPLMDAETWFTGAEALDMKLVDELHEPEAKPAATWNLAAYANAPKPPAHSPAAAPATPAATTAAAVQAPAPAAPVLDRGQADRLIALANGFKKAA